LSYNFIGLNPMTFMRYDILALQELYGAAKHNHGDTLYKFDNIAGVRVVGTDQYYGAENYSAITLWDSGGRDTYDFSNLAEKAGGYDLRMGAGEFSHQHIEGFVRPSMTAQNLINRGIEAVSAIAYNVTIEDLIGTTSKDWIYGNDVGNWIQGNAGDDSIYGYGGNDTLNGGAGADRLVGGVGNDTYIVDHAADVVIEKAGEGTDSVRASVSYALAGNIENLTLTGREAINGRGNTLDNVLIGNVASNTLNGGAGADRLVGGVGNDTYIVDHAADVVIEKAGEGTDSVRASVSYALAGNIENLTLIGREAINGTGNSLDNILRGNAEANILTGGAGNDTLVGGLGQDTLIGGTGNDWLTGGAGSDVFQYGRGDGRDTITDFENNVDKLVLFADRSLLHLTDAMNGVWVDFGSDQGVFVKSMTSASLMDDLVLMPAA